MKTVLKCSHPSCSHPKCSHRARCAQVLPEYLVEYEYVMQNAPARDPAGSFMSDLVERGVLQPQNETEANDMGPLARSLVKFLYQCDAQASDKKQDEAMGAILAAPPAIRQSGK